MRHFVMSLFLWNSAITLLGLPPLEGICGTGIFSFPKFFRSPSCVFRWFFWFVHSKFTFELMNLLILLQYLGVLSIGNIEFYKLLIVKFFTSFKDSGLWLPGILPSFKLILVFRRQTFAFHYSSNSSHHPSIHEYKLLFLQPSLLGECYCMSSQSTLNYISLRFCLQTKC